MNIFNFDGTLVCEDPLPPNDDGLPEGTYLFSCYGCHMVEGNLTCTHCLDEARARHNTTIRIAGCNMFGNRAGKLQCDELVRDVESWQVDSSGSVKHTESDDPGDIDHGPEEGILPEEPPLDGEALPDFEGAEQPIDAQEHEDSGEGPPGHLHEDSIEAPAVDEIVDDARKQRRGKKKAKMKKSEPPAAWEHDTPDGRRAAFKLPGAELENSEDASYPDDDPNAHPVDDPGPDELPMHPDESGASVMQDGLDPDPLSMNPDEAGADHLQDDLAPDALHSDSADHSSEAPPDDLSPDPMQGADYNSDIQPDDLGPDPSQGADYNSDIQPDDLGSETSPEQGADYNSDIVPEDLGPDGNPPQGADYNSDIQPDDLADYNSDIQPDDLADYNSDIQPDDLGSGEEPPPDTDYSLPHDAGFSESADSDNSHGVDTGIMEDGDVHQRDHSEL